MYEHEEEDWDQDDDDDVRSIPCPYCGEDIHEDAEYCPRCDTWISREDQPAKRRSAWIIIVVLLLIAGIVLSFV